jgi:tetratricopeptide (TPR) repeat protein
LFRRTPFTQLDLLYLAAISGLVRSNVLGRSWKILALLGSLLTFLSISAAIAQNTTWNDCELAARDPDRSIAACSKVLARPLSRAHAAAFHNRALAFAAKGNLDRAISDVSAGIRLDPQRAYRWQERGELYTRQGKYQEGIADITEAIRLDPTPRAFRFHSRAEAYRGLGDLTRAIADFDEAIRLDSVPRSFRFSDRGNALRDAGQYERALADYETALKLAPTNAWIVLQRGRAYARMGRSEEAKTDFESALTLDPSNEELKRYVEAELAELAGLAGTSPPFSMSPTERMPPSSPPSQQPPPAQKLEDVRKKAESGDAIAQFTLGRMYANGTSVAKDETQAVAWFQKAAEQGNADAQYALGLSYDTGRGVVEDGSQALDWYKKAAEQGHKEAGNRLGERASIIDLIRSTVIRIQDELLALPIESRDRIKEIAARLATARDTMPFSDLNSLRVEADNANGVLDKANEFRRVSEIASSRMAFIEAELAQITSDAPIILEIQDAMKSVRLEQKGSNLNTLQDTLGKLNKLYDTNRDQLGRWKFNVH